MSSWVTNFAPPEGEDVLVKLEDGSRCVGYYYNGGWYSVGAEDTRVVENEISKPIAWMNLPNDEPIEEGFLDGVVQEMVDAATSVLQKRIDEVIDKCVNKVGGADEQ